ncbi:relaxase domain-containing protein [Streptomyces sp. NBC_00443]|uniref:relaxase domain-containing protein n=1 Tax=Streptomyces sp. NBC_00443 TaxID=2975743 RepID=UPI002E23A57C
MISVAKVQRRNAWRYYVRGVSFGDGRRPARRPLKDAQEMAGLPPGVWMGRGLSALGLTAGETVTQRQMELVFGQVRHPDARETSWCHERLLRWRTSHRAESWD